MSFSLPLTTSWSTTQQSYLGQGFKRNFRKREIWCGSAESLEGKSTEGWFTRAITKTLNGLHSTGSEVFDFIACPPLLLTITAVVLLQSVADFYPSIHKIQTWKRHPICINESHAHRTQCVRWSNITSIPADSSSKIVLTKQKN